VPFALPQKKPEDQRRRRGSIQLGELAGTAQAGSNLKSTAGDKRTERQLKGIRENRRAGHGGEKTSFGSVQQGKKEFKRSPAGRERNRARTEMGRHAR